MKFNQFSIDVGDGFVTITQDNTCEYREYEDEVTLSIEQIDFFIAALKRAIEE